MRQCIVGREAVFDVLRIWFFIADDDEEAATRVQTEIYEKFESLARQPGQGHRRADLTKADVLFFPIYSYLIVYRSRDETVEILAVVHGGRRLRRLLRGRII